MNIHMIICIRENKNQTLKFVTFFIVSRNNLQLNSLKFFLDASNLNEKTF